MFGITTVKMNVLGGDLEPGEWTCTINTSSGQIAVRKGFGKEHTLTPASVEMVTEENKGKLLRTTGWALVGFAALGPLGAIAGMLGTRSKKKICFAFTSSQGPRFVATADSGAYSELLAASFAAKR
jgi:hypothetical protein